MLDDRTTVRDVPAHIGTFTWTRDLNRFGWRSFLGQEPGGAAIPQNAVSARAQSLAGLPSTFVSVGALDLFVNEDVAFVQRLINEGVSTELFVAPGVFHGAGDAAITRHMANLCREALLRAFER